MAFGIICEYNPFHNGHLYQIKEIKKISDEPIVCIMSGNFVQRGDVAIVDKYARAKMAVESGADLVLELPVPFCMASAEYFASCGAYILNQLGVDKLCFGSESADIERIMSAARVACTDEFRAECTALSRSEGNAASYFKLLAEKSGIGDIQSNDILAIEYAKAIIKNGYDIQIYPILRQGSGYRETELAPFEYPSASAIRERFASGDKDVICDIAEHVPKITVEMLEMHGYASFKNEREGLLLALRLIDPKDVDVAVSDKGLVNRILSLSHKSPNIEYLLDKLQTKKYTSAAIRRAMLYILLNIKQSDLDAKPTYTTLLGADEKGTQYLSSIRKSARELKVVTKPADAPKCRQLEIDKRADAMYSMCFKYKLRSEFCRKKSPYII